MKIGMQTWGSNGDVRPFLALAGGLTAAGHQVSLVVTSPEQRDYKHYGPEMGIPITQVGKLDPEPAEETIRFFIQKLLHSKNPVNQLDNILTNLFEPMVPAMYEASQQLCLENDAIICHFMHYPAQAAAEKADLPCSTLMLNHSVQIFSSPRLPESRQAAKPFVVETRQLLG